MGDEPDLRGCTRRRLLGGAAGIGLSGLAPSALFGLDATGREPADRMAAAYSVRLQAAEAGRRHGPAAQRANGDEERVPGMAACYSKGLPHSRSGEVDRHAYEVLAAALRSGRPEDFERVPLGGFVKLANPQAAWAYELVGPDSSQLACAAAPAFAGAEQAAELAELYWQAILRDVAFSDYATHPLAAQAADDLSRLSAFRGPKLRGKVEAATLFRGATAGDLAGPYLSQFLLKAIPLTPIAVEQRIRTAAPTLDYVTTFEDWLAIQNGALAGVNRFDDQPRYIRNGRDLGEYVHRDFSYQPYLTACLTALKMGTPPGGANPYKHSRTQSGFTTFGQPYLLYVLAVVTQVALDACWYQKWRVHRRLRPEELAGRVEAQLRGLATYPLHHDVLVGGGLEAIRRRHGSALLPQAYPEGCPAHPSYPAGHAAIAGACVTALKAMLDGSHVVPQPVVPSADGTSLLPYQGPDLTVAGELEKLASNVAGLHWRTDATAGLKLGETVAIRVLGELKRTGNELFSGWDLRCFDGTRVVV
jgi:hypothetical protein